MVESSSLKIPYEDLQKYLEMSDICISSLIKQEKVGLITRADLEQKLPNSFLKVQQCLVEILKDNKINDPQPDAEHGNKILTLLSD